MRYSSSRFSSLASAPGMRRRFRRRFSEVQPPESGHVAQPRRDRAGQLVPADVQLLEVNDASPVPPEPGRSRRRFPRGSAIRRTAHVAQPARAFGPVNWFRPDVQLLEVRVARQRIRNRPVRVLPHAGSAAEAGSCGPISCGQGLSTGSPRGTVPRGSPAPATQPERRPAWPFRLRSSYGDQSGGVGRHHVPVGQRRRTCSRSCRSSNAMGPRVAL